MQITFTWPVRMWGCSLNEAHYYGWRLWLHAGPAYVLVSKCMQDNKMDARRNASASENRIKDRR